MKPKESSLDAQLKAELEKLKKLLRAEKAHEKFGFSKIKKIFGWLRLSDDESAFFRFSVSRNWVEVEEESRKEVDIFSEDFKCGTKLEFESHPLLESETQLNGFLKALPEKYSFSIPRFKDNEESYFKCFIIGTNGMVKSPKNKFDYLLHSKTEGLSENKVSLQNQSDLHQVPLKLETSLSLETKLINPLLLRQYLTPSLNLPHFVAEEELDEDRVKELQVEYREWGLDNGEFFDGYLFRNEFGDPFKEHPSKRVGWVNGKGKGK